MFDANFVKQNEYIALCYRCRLGKLLTDNSTPLSYFFDDDFYIGIFVHELGHVIDRLYYVGYEYSQVHAFMWESFYFMEYYRLIGSTIQFFGDYRFLNPPNDINCVTIDAALNSIPANVLLPIPTC